MSRADLIVPELSAGILQAPVFRRLWTFAARTSAIAGEEGPGGAPRPQHRLPPPALVDFARQGPDRDAAISSGWTVA